MHQPTLSTLRLNPHRVVAGGLTVFRAGAKKSSRTKLRPKFIDRARIMATGGDGGNGKAARFRDSWVANGPANGGSGGRGGDVILRASHNVTDLNMGQSNVNAQRGGNGGTDDMKGSNGKAHEVLVPCGTTVTKLGSASFAGTSQMEPMDAPRTELGELLRDGDSLVVAKGGDGGRGNGAFPSRLLHTLRLSEIGFPGEAVTLLLSLKLIADVGLVGFPNAGKSSLLRALSNATPEVAAYPFTTLHPHLGKVYATREDHFTLADIPGLVDGAHANRGLGHSFLRHIERTSLLCYVVDLADQRRTPLQQLVSLRSELALYRPGLERRPCMLVANKADDEGALRTLKEFRVAVAEMRAMGQLPELLTGAHGREEGDGGGGGGAEGDGTGGGAAAAADAGGGTASHGGSAVTAISALHAKNLPRLVARMRTNLLFAKAALHEEAQREARRQEAASAARVRDARAAHLDETTAMAHADHGHRRKVRINHANVGDGTHADGLDEAGGDGTSEADSTPSLEDRQLIDERRRERARALRGGETQDAFGPIVAP